MIKGFVPWVESYSGGLRLCVRYRDVLTGKVKKISTRLEKDTKKARREAEKVLEQKINASEKKTDYDALTLSELVDLYIEDMRNDKSIADSTVNRNTVCCRSILKILGEDVLVCRIASLDILGLLTKTGETAERKNNRLERFKVLIRWAYRHNYIQDVNFLMKLKPFPCPPHKERIKDKFMDATELKRVLDAMNGEHHILFTKFLVLSGCRTGEAVALKKSDIDVSARTIVINKTYNSNQKCVNVAKTQASMRTIHIQPQLLELLKQIEVYYKRMELRTGSRSDLLFHAEDGGYFSYYAYRKQLAKASEQVLGRKLTPHALRHSHASLLFEQSFTVDEVQHRLGHSKSQVTRDIYIHVTRELQEKENRKLDGFRIG